MEDVLMYGTTLADGSAVVNSPRPVTGDVYMVEVEGEALTDGADLTLANGGNAKAFRIRVFVR